MTKKYIIFLNLTKKVTEYYIFMDKFLETLKTTNKISSFYFDFDDILEIERMKEDIKKLNILIGEEDFDNKLKEIILNNSQIVNILPLLVAQRELILEVLVEYSYDNPWINETYLFDVKSPDYNVDKIVDFFDKLGIKSFFQNEGISDVYSYILGIHLGMRTHSRKNKSGVFMEQYIENYLANMCNKYDLKYISQATPKLIFKEFGIKLPKSLNRRRFDFVIFKNNKLTLIEANFYNSSGSKLKAVAEEFIRLNAECDKCSDIENFVWITDGSGWKSEKKTLEKIFNEVDSVINLNDMHNKWIERKIDCA